MHPLKIVCGKFNSLMHSVLCCHSAVGISGSLAIGVVIFIIIVIVVLSLKYYRAKKTRQCQQSKSTSF